MNRYGCQGSPATPPKNEQKPLALDIHQPNYEVYIIHVFHKFVSVKNVSSNIDNFIFNSKLFPIPFVDKGTAPVKYQITCILIGLFVISAYKISKNTGKCDYISYKYILLALMIAVVAEICFVSFKTATSFYNELGHILRCAYYYFIFRLC